MSACGASAYKVKWSHGMTDFTDWMGVLGREGSHQSMPVCTAPHPGKTHGRTWWEIRKSLLIRNPHSWQLWVNKLPLLISPSVCDIQLKHTNIPHQLCWPTNSARELQLFWLSNYSCLNLVLCDRQSSKFWKYKNKCIFCFEGACNSGRADVL